MSDSEELSMALKYDMSSCSVTYSGKSDEDLETFHLAFIEYATLRDYKAEKLVLALKSRIRGNARIFLNSIPESEKDSIAKVIALLRKNFEGDAWKWNVETKLLARKQGPDETIDSYVTDILRLCTQLKKTDAECLSLFLRGLKPSIRAFVFAKQPKSFDQALNAARLAVAVNDTANESLSIGPIVNPIVVNAVQENAVKTTLDQLSGLMTNVVDRLEKLEVNKQKDLSIENDRVYQPMSYAQSVHSYSANQRPQSLRSDYTGQRREPFPPDYVNQEPQPLMSQHNYANRRSRSFVSQNTYANQRPVFRCNRCNRVGHKWRRCFARTHENGTPLN